MKSVFVETGNVTAFRRAVLTVEDTERGQPGIVVAWGQAGRGKTFTARNSYTERGGVFLSAWEGMSQAAFLSKLCFEVTGDQKCPRSAHACKIRIVETLEKRRKQGGAVTIYMDEADRLAFGRVEDLRDIHEATGAAVILIGEEELIGLLSQRRRVWSRVTQEVPFGPVDEADIAAFALEAASLDLTPEACAMVRTTSDGDMRLVRNMVQLLEQAAKARETNRADAAMVKAIQKQRSWRRA
ncbi:MAG TPA: DNA transposition protein [Desulfovibrio sp.]|nr:DNA transposition protein [Desulfovibrio sp.]